MVEQKECSKMLAHKIQMPGNHPKEKNITDVYLLFSTASE
jgi:hypothetical protein